MSITVDQLTEGQLLARIIPRLRTQHEALLGPGDDAAIVAAPDGRFVISIDTAVQDKDFRLKWPNGYASSGFDVGWKTAAQNLSDVNAMGAVATSLVVSLAMPGQTPVEWVEDFADGIAAAIDGLGASVCSAAGGDLSSADEIVISIAVTGSLEGRPGVLRSGARAGDNVAVCGVLGMAAAGWALQESSVQIRSYTESMQAAVDVFNRPQPPLLAGPAAAEAGATAMMDVSDGLLRDGQRLAQASAVSLDLNLQALQSLGAELADAAQALSADSLQWTLSGGESYALLCTFPAEATLPQGFTVIGSVVAATAGGAQVLLDGQNYKSAVKGAVGWDHFAV